MSMGFGQGVANSKAMEFTLCVVKCITNSDLYQNYVDMAI